LFMGEEWGARTPFPFFCDFDGELAEAIRQGRRREFAEAYETYGDDVPDPLAVSTFKTAKLDWDEWQDEGSDRHRLIKALLAVRKEDVIPRLPGVSFGRAELQPGSILSAHWRFQDGGWIGLLANLSDQSATRSHALAHGRAIWGGQAPERLPAWSVFWAL